MPNFLKLRAKSWAVPGCALFLLCSPALAAAQPQGPTGAPLTCKQMWAEAMAQAEHAALAQANLAAGTAPAGASLWAATWAARWKSVWQAQGDALPSTPGLACCDHWFETAAQAGKDAWTQAMQAAPVPSGAAGAWATKFSAAYAKAWADAWFLGYPVLCAQAKVNASAKALVGAGAAAKGGAFAWANAVALAGAFAYAAQASYQTAWGESQASAWAEAGAVAEAEANAVGESSSYAQVANNCARVHASSCVQAAASAFAAAWASSGASAFADAYADAWAQAYAAAFATAWAQSASAAGGIGFSQAAAKALATAVADGYAAAWQEKLAKRTEVAQIVHWWMTPNSPKPPIAQISRLLARDERSAMQAVAANALKKAIGGQIAWAIALRAAADKASAGITAYASSWVDAWAQSWAADWATNWIDTYIAMCSQAAAAACVECPPCDEEESGEQPSQEDAGWPPQPDTDEEEPPQTISKPQGFTYTMVGLGVTAGNVFRMIITNETAKPIVVYVPAGTVFDPDDSADQREEMSTSVRIHVPANGTAQAPLNGYCLDYGKQAPPSEQLGLLTREPLLEASLEGAVSYAEPASRPAAPAHVNYTVDTNPNAGAPVLKIIIAGNRLSATGKYHTDMPPDRYKMAVIQRAIWVYESRGTSAPHTRDTLVNDIRKQVKETGGTQTEQQIQDLATHIMDDVNATLTAAGV